MKVYHHYPSGRSGPSQHLTKLTIVSTNGAEYTLTPTADGRGFDLAVSGEYGVSAVPHADGHCTWGVTVTATPTLKRSRGGLPR